MDAMMGKRIQALEAIYRFGQRLLILHEGFGNKRCWELNWEEEPKWLINEIGFDAYQKYWPNIVTN